MTRSKFNTTIRDNHTGANSTTINKAKRKNIATIISPLPPITKQTSYILIVCTGKTFKDFLCIVALIVPTSSVLIS